MKFLNLNFSAKGGSASGGRFSKLLEKIYPQPPMGGLEINDSIVRLVQFKGSAPVVRAYRLPPGVVEAGQLKDKAKLIPILREMAQFSGGQRKLSVILTISSSNVFIQTVNLPPLALQNLEEAAELNVRMISPIRQGEFYYDWQRITTKDEPGRPIELLAAFVSRQIVKDFTDCLEEAGISLVAVEFTSLSLVRELVRKGIVKSDKPYLIAEIRPEGTTFILVSMKQLLFHSFHSWGSAEEQAGAIEVNEFLTTLTQAVNNISNFYLTHWGGLVNDLIFINFGLENEIRTALKAKAVTFLKSEEATPAAGAASRAISGSQSSVGGGGGKEINLLGMSSLEIVRQSRALRFVTLWRNIFITIFGFLLLLTLGADLFLRQLNQRTMELNNLALNEPAHQELSALKEKASKFDQLTSLLKEIRQRESHVGSVAGLINNLAGVDIKINRLDIPSSDWQNSQITLNGIAANEQAAIAFKNRLARETTFTGVELPLSAITPETGGRVVFTVFLRSR